jgi:hypothetical protein
MPHSPSHGEIHDKTTAKHRWVPTPAEPRSRSRRPTVTARRFPGLTKLTLAFSVLTCLAVAVMASSASATTSQSDSLVASGFVEQVLTGRSSRSADRAATGQSTKVTPTPAPSVGTDTAEELARKKAAAATSVSPSASPSRSPTPTVSPSPSAAPGPSASASASASAGVSAKASADAAKNPTPVAGLNQLQMNNAKAIVDAGKALNLSKRAYVLAIACSLQESRLLNLASSALPSSFLYSNEGAGSDHDSIGLFQQRPNWGSVQNLMTPSYAATLFYNALQRISGWQNMALTDAVQAVQISAFPDAYAQHETQATTIVDALTK